jgi:hypothetical protein
MQSTDAEGSIRADEEDASLAAATEILASDDGSIAPSRPLLMIPILVGMFVLALNILLMTAGVARGPFTRISWSLPGNISVALISASLFIGIFLVVYALVIRNRGGKATADSGRWYLYWIVAPLGLGVLAVLATLWSLRSLQAAENPNKPCLDLYQQAQSIRRDNPNFKMPIEAADQLRCKINESLG